TCVACNQPSDCTAQTTACITNTCTGNACGTANASNTTACTDNGGSVCDGNGTCVACNVDGDCGGSQVCNNHLCVACNKASDCTAQASLCKINTCTSMVCGTNNASQGTTCTDNGGSVCDANGACVECNTDNDCTGAKVCSPAG